MLSIDTKKPIQNPTEYMVDIFNRRGKKMNPDTFVEVVPSSGLLEEFL